MKAGGLAFLVLAALVAAGCATPVPVPDVLPVDPFGFGQPIFVAPGGDVESTLHVTQDGAILICSHGGFEQPSPMWVSRDDGATFEALDPQPNPIISGDCDLASNDDGQWSIVYDTIASSTVATSSDAGQSWDLSYVTALPIGVDRPWIAWVGDELYMTYANVMAAMPSIHMFARSTDGGQTWLEHTPINTAEAPDDIQAVLGKLALFDDTIRVPIARSNLQLGGQVTLVDAVSRDRGATWSQETVYGPYDAGGLILPTSAVAGDTLYWTVNLPNGSMHDVHVLRSDDRGETWSEPILVAPGIDFAGVVGPWIDGRPDGSATLAFVHGVEGGWTVSSVRIDDDGIHGPVMLAEPESRDQGIGHEFIMVDHHPDGRAMVAWIMDTGPECARDPDGRRSLQCVYLAIEDA